MDNGKLEALITSPGTWVITCEDNGGTQNVTIPAGTFYHSNPDSNARTFPEELALAINTAMTAAWTVTVSAGEGATGKYTIANDDTFCEFDFGAAPDLQVLLGFATDVYNGATTYTSAGQAKGLWLPQNPSQSFNGDSTSGRIESDKQSSENSIGNVYSIMGRRKRVQSLTWPAESRARTMAANEVTANESFETFYIDCLLGEATWGRSSGPIRWHPDADLATSFEYAFPGEWQPQEVRAHFKGIWSITLDRLVEVPS